MRTREGRLGFTLYLRDPLLGFLLHHLLLEMDLRDLGLLLSLCVGTVTGTEKYHSGWFVVLEMAAEGHRNNTRMAVPTMLSRGKV